MRTAQCAVGPPFHRRPPAAKMAAPHTGGSRSVATAAKMAALHIGEPIMGSRRPGGSLLKLREMARIRKIVALRCAITGKLC